MLRRIVVFISVALTNYSFALNAAEVSLARVQTVSRQIASTLPGFFIGTALRVFPS